MNNDLNRFMAEKVMKAIFRERKKPSPNYYIFDSERIVYEYRWHPITDMNQEMMCVKELKTSGFSITQWIGWQIHFNPSVDSTHSFSQFDKEFYFPDDNIWDKLPFAICQAIKEALSE